jgi:hypothetical protein
MRCLLFLVVNKFNAITSLESKKSLTIDSNIFGFQESDQLY